MSFDRPLFKSIDLYSIHFIAMDQVANFKPQEIIDIDIDSGLFSIHSKWSDGIGKRTDLPGLGWV